MVSRANRSKYVAQQASRVEAGKGKAGGRQIIPNQVLDPALLAESPKAGARGGAKDNGRT